MCDNSGGSYLKFCLLIFKGPEAPFPLIRSEFFHRLFFSATRTTIPEGENNSKVERTSHPNVRNLAIITHRDLRLQFIINSSLVARNETGEARACSTRKQLFVARIEQM